MLPAIIQRVLPPAGILALLALGFAPAAQAQEPLTGGARIYFEKGQCNQCHGSKGNGVGDDAREHGANFHESALSKDDMIQVISCGIPGTAMPYFDKFSYTDDRCGGTEADMGENMPQRPLANFLAKRDIEAVAQYIQDTFVGKPVDESAPAAAPTPAPAAH